MIAGHRDTFFRRLREVQVGDKILIQRSGHDYNYGPAPKRLVIEVRPFSS